MRPRGARHDIDVLGSALPTVSIHAPAGGATSSVTHVEVPDIPFQSTRPRGARRSWYSSVIEHDGVSIHAPAGGATSIFFPSTSDTSFQSTRPRGARLKSEERFTPVLFRFQSTRPRGARRHRVTAHLCRYACFNPRARGGRDPNHVGLMHRK